MEINKQLFKNVLAGKLKGMFVLRNGCKISSDTLCYSPNRSYGTTTYPYRLSGFSEINLTYTEDGIYSLYASKSEFDIIAFIPDTNMKETKEIKIEIPNGYCIDESKSTFEKIVFKKKDTKPKSWEEYYKNNCKNKVFEGIQFVCGAVDDKYGGISSKMDSIWQVPMNLELAEAFLAMMQLMSLRQAWIGDWEPDWDNIYSHKYIIAGENNNGFRVYTRTICRSPLSFPTKDMAEEFLKCFKDLIKTAKPLL